MVNLIPWKKKEVTPRFGNGANLSPWSGMTGLSRFHSEFERLFDRFFNDWPTPWGDNQTAQWSLDMDEKEDSILVRAEAPGFEPADFDLQVRGNTLSIHAQKKVESEIEGGSRWGQSEFHRSFTLPIEVEADKVEAKYHQGVLTITLPKSEQSKAKRITVQS